jgi:hypothetical protein
MCGAAGDDGRRRPAVRDRSRPVDYAAIGAALGFRTRRMTYQGDLEPAASDDVENRRLVGRRHAHAAGPAGRSQAPIRSWMSAGKMALGMTACTALAGIEL